MSESSESYTTRNNPYTAPEDRVMWAILTSVRDGVVGVEHARIYARAALAEMETAPKNEPHRCNEFVARCELIMSVVFHRNYNERQIFSEWLRGLIAESANTFWILHEHPLYIVAEYLGIDSANVETGQFGAEYIRLAQRQNW